MNQSHRRLMDLLAGWAQYVSRCIEDKSDGVLPEDYEREFDEIWELYQAVGKWEASDEDLTKMCDYCVRSSVLSIVKTGQAE